VILAVIAVQYEFRYELQASDTPPRRGPNVFTGAALEILLITQMAYSKPVFSF
jgi:hypothetical protein